MKKMKLAALIAAAALLCAGLSLFSGCADKSSQADDGLYYPQEETETASIEISSANLTVEQYDSAELTATLVGSEEEIVWSVSDADSAIIRYENGMVYGLGIGSAKVIASAGSGENAVRAECSVTVTESTSAPVLHLNAYTVEIGVGGSFTVVPSVTWEGSAVTEPLEYSYTFADGAIQYATGLERQADGSAVITGRRAGTTTYLISTTCRGILVVESFSVVVRDISVLFLSDDLTPAESGYELSLAAGETFSPEIRVYVDGALQETPALSWRSFNTSIVSVSADGEITAKAAGVAGIACTYQGEEFRFTCIVTA